MAERSNYPEKPKYQFLKKLFFVTAGLFAAGIIAVELLPNILHLFRAEISEIQISGGVNHHTLRRIVAISS